MKFIGVSIFLCLLAASQSRGQVFADVSTTLGDFTIQLDHGNAPLAVANFVRLSEGTIPWLDEETGAVNIGVPYYTGIVFHRVIAGFVSQVGSRNGQGTDGPGYNFRDEVDNGLTHNAAYIVSMANSGPNTNGSQIFITASAQPGLDGKHTVFGTVTAGQSVCDAINAVATDSSDKPLTPVVINSITVRKEGGVSFDETLVALPTVEASSATVQHDGTGAALEFLQSPRSTANVYHSPDLENWTPSERFLDAEASAAVSMDFTVLTNGQSRYFFRTSVATYPPDAVFSQSLDNRNLSLTLIVDDGSNTSLGTISYSFDDVGTGTYTSSDLGSGNITSYTYTPDGYGGSLLVFTNGIVPIRFRLGLDNFNTSTIAGRYTGTIFANNGSFPSRGTFTLTR
ncbi:MAG: peptidylprolyl isomerase [Verrucomicrobiota bacterium]